MPKTRFLTGENLQKKCLTWRKGSTIMCHVDHSERTRVHQRPGQLPKRSNGTDCKSVAQASKVRILHCPPKVLLFCPCGAVVAHSLGKTVVVGSIPTTGSRGFRLTLGLLGLMLFISLQPTFIKYHIDGQDLCLRLLTDRHYTSLSTVNVEKVISFSDQIG